MNQFAYKIKNKIRYLREKGFRYITKLLCKRIIKKVGTVIIKVSDKINYFQRLIAKKLETGFIEIIKVKTYVNDPYYNHVYYIYLFGKQIYPSKRGIYCNTWVDPNQPVIYLKINRLSDYAKPCVQHWVNIAYHLKADYFFICDNKQLEYHLLRTVTFPGASIKFITSMRKPLKDICETISSPRWRNAAFANLTAFYYSKKNSYQNFWSIDADDTMICLKCDRVAELLKMVQNKANDCNMSALSLDMWRSRTLGRHWSWGIAYVNNNVDFCSIFEKNRDMEWTHPYADLDVAFNFDWFFTYLKENKSLKIETFYVENMYFIHWGNFLRTPLAGAVFFWEKDRLIFPIMKYIYENENLGNVKITDCLKIEFDVSKKEGLFFLENEVPTVKWMAPQLRKFNNVRDWCRLEYSMEKL